MRRIISFFIAILSLQSISAQPGGTVMPGGVVVANVLPPPVHLQDVFSTPVQPKSPPGTKGSSFINDNWLLANLTFADGRIADSIFVKLNAYTNKIHFKDENGEEMEVAVKVTEITIIDKDPAWQYVVFRTGYSDDMNAFFRVLADGKRIQLLKKIMVNIWEARAPGEDKKTFELGQELFFSSNRQLYRANKRCSYLTEVFETKKEKILQFITANNIKCNKEDDMKRLAVFINSL